MTAVKFRDRFPLIELNASSIEGQLSAFTKINGYVAFYYGYNEITKYEFYYKYSKLLDKYNNSQYLIEELNKQ